MPLFIETDTSPAIWGIAGVCFGWMGRMQRLRVRRPLVTVSRHARATSTCRATALPWVARPNRARVEAVVFSGRQCLRKMDARKTLSCIWISSNVGAAPASCLMADGRMPKVKSWWLWTWSRWWRSSRFASLLARNERRRLGADLGSFGWQRIGVQGKLSGS